MRDFDVKHILAPTDLDEAAFPALAYARFLAERTSAKLTVLYAEPIAYPYTAVEPPPGTMQPALQDEAVLRQSVEEHVAPALAGWAHEVVVMTGQPIQTILHTARERDVSMIVMATHARRGWRRAILGSVTEGVIHGSRCPVMTLRTRSGSAGAKQSVTKILCPINFTEVARESLFAAARLAQTFGAELLVAFVVEQGEEKNERWEAEVRLWIPQELREISSPHQLVLRGGAAERVLDAADDFGAELLVVGAQQKAFRDATVIGSTTERLIRFANCPVLVCPRG
ncbi:MAG TPA: universal stress protein [Thermoanaerobaculia bacterium]|nr:universal stress protein [Thermoanaerobaculia bacterium]